MTVVSIPLTRNIDFSRSPLDLGAYEATDGYRGLHEIARGLNPAEVLDRVKESGLKGRGGAGFPTGLKWSFVPMGENAPKQKYFVVNADEMEPGTFKDRLLMEGDPHLLIDGMIIASYAIQASKAYIFLRGEYTDSEKILRKALAQAYERGYLGRNILDHRLRSRHHIAHQRGALYLRRRDRAVERAGRQARQSARQAAVSAG